MQYIALGMPGPTEMIIIGAIFLIAFVIPSAVVAFVAWNYGRSPIAWFLLSIFATPLISLIALALVGRLDAHGAERRGEVP